MKPKVLINIHEFGPLRNQVLEFAPFLLFTGHSGLGKSYANYLMYYLLRSLSSSEWFGILDKKVHKESSVKFELSINEILGYLSEHVQDFMQGFLGDSTLTCNVEYVLDFEESGFSPLLNVENNEIKAETQDGTPDVFQLLTSITKVNGEANRLMYIDADAEARRNRVGRAINEYLQVLLFGRKYLKSVIMPPARGALVGENYSLKKEVTSSCKMYDYFIRDYEDATRISRMSKSGNDENSFFVNRVRRLLHGELVSEKGIQYLVLSPKKRIPLTSAASSVKELSPFLFYLKNWSEWNFSFCIEEPEAHLHPSMQMDLADLIAACRNKGMMFQMTTHSDYFILRINQLLRIGKLRTEAFEQYKEFQNRNQLNNRFYLKEDEVICYYFEQQETGEVNVKKLSLDNGVLPMNTFYKAMNQLDDFDRKLNDEFEELV